MAQSIYSQCSNSLHLKCSRMNKNGYLSHQQKTLNYAFEFCTDYKCIKCEKHVYYGQKGILCSGCDLWIHKKCAGNSLCKYELTEDTQTIPGVAGLMKMICFLFLDPWMISF